MLRWRKLTWVLVAWTGVCAGGLVVELSNALGFPAGLAAAAAVFFAALLIPFGLLPGLDCE